jgi:hypothetical protein
LFGTGGVIMKRVIIIFGMIVLTGCSAHSPFIIKNTTDVTAVSQSKYPAHSNKVLVTSQTLPESAKFEVLEHIEVGKIWYGSSKNVALSLAERARAIGADAVIEYKTWHQPSGFSWYAPHGSGKAIKILDKSSVDRSSIKGEWL